MKKLITLLAKFFDSVVAPIFVSFIAVFLYTYLSGRVDFYSAFFISLFFSFIAGWIFAIPITHFLADFFEKLSKQKN